MKKHPRHTLDFSEITDGIFIGTNQCCQTHFDKHLLSHGINAAISLEEERIDAPFGIDFYIWLPVKDHAAPSPEQLAFGVSALKQLVAMKKKVYVHCKNGHGRAPTLVAAYLIAKGKTPSAAEAFIKTKRPPIHFEDAQRRALADFDRQ